MTVTDDHIEYIETNLTFYGITDNGFKEDLLNKYDKPNAPGLSIGIVENGKLMYSKGLLLSSEGNVRRIVFDKK